MSIENVFSDRNYQPSHTGSNSRHSIYPNPDLLAAQRAVKAIAALSRQVMHSKDLDRQLYRLFDRFMSLDMP